MQGRVHFYEGYPLKDVVFPMRVFGRLGIRSAILTNAAGAINLDFNQGALVVIRDHMDLQGSNPLIGPNDKRFGPRFPDMSQAYYKPYREFTRIEAENSEFRFTKEFTRRFQGRVLKLPPKFATSRPLALTWWACPPFRK